MARIPSTDPRNAHDWVCVNIKWPRDGQWLGILFGLLTAPSRGRFWDGDSGNVVDAQHRYAAVFERNWPLVECNIGEDYGKESTVTPGVAPGAMMGECQDMSCGACLRWSDDGVLEFYTCGQWVAVAGEAPAGLMGQTSVSSPAEEVPLDDAGVDENINCRLSYAAATAIQDVHLSLLDVMVDNPLRPDRWVGLLRGRLPQYDIDGYNIAFALQFLVGVLAASSELELVDTSDDDFVAYLSHVMRPGFSDNSYDISGLERSAVGLLLLSANAQNEQGFGIKAALEGAYWQSLWLSLEGDSIPAIEQAARAIPSGTLDCEYATTVAEPEYIIPVPEGATWVVDWDFRQNSHFFQNGDTYYIVGRGLVSNTPNVSFNNESYFWGAGRVGEILAIALDEEHHPDVGSEALYNGLECPAASPSVLISAEDIIFNGVREWQGSIPYTDPKAQDLHIGHNATVVNPGPTAPSVIRRIVVFGSGDVPWGGVPVTVLE